MDSGNSRRFESVFSKKIRAGKRRTYFFDVRQTKGNDYYLTLTESTRKFNGDGYERHKIFLYKEDFNRFQEGLEEALNHIKTELMPDYDYDEYKRRHEEYERLKAEEAANAEAMDGTVTEETSESVAEETTSTEPETEAPAAEMPNETPTEVDDVKEQKLESEDDMSW